LGGLGVGQNGWDGWMDAFGHISSPDFFFQSNLSIPKIFEAIIGITGAQRTFDTNEIRLPIPALNRFLIIKLYLVIEFFIM
jgi:hypothetical protein